MTLDQFPILAANFLDKRYLGTPSAAKRREALENAIAAIATGLTNGAITNPVYVDVKATIARAFEEAWDNVVGEVYTYGGKWESLSRPEYDLYWSMSKPQSHTIAGMLKKIEKSKIDTPMTRDMVAFLKEIGPLGLAVVKLKDMVVKRQPKEDPAAARKAKYDAPDVSASALGEFKALLVKVTEEAYGELLRMLTERNGKLVDRWVELENASQALPFNQRHKSKEGQHADQIAANHPFIYQCVTGTDTGRNQRTYTRNDKADGVVAKVSKEQADQTREYFIYKNLDKIASILDAKGNYKSAMLLDRTVLNGLEGTIRVEFQDGSGFTVKNAVVYVMNSYGTQFNRFPLTFTDVYLPNGARMPRPSEQRMNEVFVKA